MSGQVVRGRWLSGGARFLRAHYPMETSERLLGNVQKALRVPLLDLDPVQWFPRTHHVELMRAIATVRGDEPAVYEDFIAYGRFMAAEMTSGSLKQFMQVATLKLFAKKLPNLWSLEHQDDGRLESDIAQLEEACLPLRLSGSHGYDHVGVVTFGWVAGALAALGQKNVVLKQGGWSLKQAAPSEMTCEVRWS